MSRPLPDFEKLLQTIRQALPNLLAFYVFGSHASQQFDAASDVDLAILVDGPVEPLAVWALSNALANQSGWPIDLINLRAASTVFQYQVIVHGRCIWQRDLKARLFETYILSEKTSLDEARAPLLEVIQKTGRVYGR